MPRDSKVAGATVVLCFLTAKLSAWLICIHTPTPGVDISWRKPSMASHVLSVLAYAGHRMATGGDEATNATQQV